VRRNVACEHTAVVERVCAVVVTFNRRRLLAECLDALAAQTRAPDRVVVVDNGSTDGTADMLRARAAVETVRLETNRGSAGGFATGVEAARGCDWLWLMDDDAEPAPDALERLLASDAARDPAAAALCPAVVLPDGTIDVKHRGDFRRRPRYLRRDRYTGTPRLGFFTWVGVLLRAEVVRAAGPPKAELFVWADDYEYSFRVREHGEIRLVPASRVVHKDAGQAYTNRRSRFWNRLTGWDLDPTPIDAFWRNLCGIRNYIWLKRRYERQSAISAAGTAAQFMLKSLLYDERPLRRLRWIARAARDGRRGRFETITPQRWAAMLRRGDV
jgi:rhamnopyranosyl-N-acetylglucosaminyl-diphospho-decaprenol beta-1,3/1,4-galactofuranosyltransferase